MHSPRDPSDGHSPISHAAQHLQETAGRRDIFWQNVVREMLSALAATAAAASGRLTADAKGAARSTSPDHELFDGRMAVVTRLGQRIAIADVYPLFACSIPSARGSADRSIAADVQCTVFQIRTPAGEVFTIPVQEIVAVHALSEALVRRMEAAARAQAAAASPSRGSEDVSRPFGFAAFTSLAQSEAGSEAGSDGESGAGSGA